MKSKNLIRRMAVFTFVALVAFSIGVVFGQDNVTVEFAVLKAEEFAVPVSGADVTTDLETTSSEATTTENVSTTTESSGFISTLAGSPKQDLTRPDEDAGKTDIQTLLEKRTVTEPKVFNFFAYWVQKAISLGIPVNTIILIFLIPVLATLVTFVRVIIGLPSLEMLVPIVLAFAFVAVGITIGLIILSAVILASFVSRTLLRRVPIMYFPKRSLSHLFLAIFVFAALTIAIILDFEAIKTLSIFPILILTLLGDSIVSVQLKKTVFETVLITSVTLGLALIGYMLATSVSVRDALILWPELILLTVPINFMLGRYFGLRLSEVFRFRTLESYASE